MLSPNSDDTSLAVAPASHNQLTIQQRLWMHSFLAHLSPLLATETLMSKSMGCSGYGLAEMPETLRRMWRVATTWQATATEQHKHNSACHRGPVSAFWHQPHLFLQAFRRATLTVLEHWPQSARRAQMCPVLVSMVVNTLLPCDLCVVALSCSTGRECSRRVDCRSSCMRCTWNQQNM